MNGTGMEWILAVFNKKLMSHKLNMKSDLASLMIGS